MERFYELALPVVLSLVAYNSLFTGFFIAIKRRDFVGTQYLLSSLFIFGWALGFAFLVRGDLKPAAVELWGRIAYTCFFLIAVSWLHFVLSYTKHTKQFRFGLLLTYVFVFGLLFIMPYDYFILSYRNIAGIANTPVPGPVFYGLCISFVVILITAFWVLLDFWRAEKSVLKRDDARFFFFTQLYGYSLCFLCVLPVFNMGFPQYQILVLPLWQFLLAYAMIRHHLLDFEALSDTMQRDRLAAMATVSASMHHELRNPLTAIKTFAEYLPKKYDDPEFRNKFSKVVSTEVARVNELLNQLLEFSKPSDPHWGSVKVQGLLDEIIDFLIYRFKQENIEVVRHYKDDAAVTADAKQLKQVFLNLLLNGMQAMPEGGKLVIETKMDKKHYVVSIADTGVGMNKEQIKNMMDPFFTTKEKGTGLGLSIVQHILEAHDAAIHVISSPGKGTRIDLTFTRGVKAL